MTDLVVLPSAAFKLIIKGGVDPALEFDRRGIPRPTVIECVRRNKGDAGLYHCTVHCSRNVLSAWFAETDGQRAPFAAGALLHFMEV